MPSERSWQRVDNALLAAAAVALAAGALLLAKDASLLFGAARAHGDVVAVEHPGALGTTMYVPVIRFRDGSTMHVFHARPSTVPWEVGDDVDVLFDPKDPSHASADDALSLWLPALTALGAAAVFGGVGVTLRFALDEHSHGRPSGGR